MGAGLSRLEDELRWLSPSLPGPVAKAWRVWKEAARAMPSRVRSTGLGAGLGPETLPRWGGWPGCSGWWLSPVPGDRGESSASSPSSASNDFLSAGDTER